MVPVVKQSHLHNYNTSMVPIPYTKTEKKMLERHTRGLILSKQENVVGKVPICFRWIIHRTKMKQVLLGVHKKTSEYSQTPQNLDVE